jgi:hypothetical protein
MNELHINDMTFDELANSEEFLIMRPLILKSALFRIQEKIKQEETKANINFLKTIMKMKPEWAELSLDEIKNAIELEYSREFDIKEIEKSYRKPEVQNG